MITRVFLIFILFTSNLTMAQGFVLKWDKQRLQVTIPTEESAVYKDTINEVNYFEYIDDHYDFAFDMIKKKEEGFVYVKDLYEYALKELEREGDVEMDEIITGKLDGLNSFYAVVEETATDAKTGGEYKYIVGELIFYSEDKKKLFYFDIEFDEVPASFVEGIIKSVKFY